MGNVIFILNYKEYIKTEELNIYSFTLSLF